MSTSIRGEGLNPWAEDQKRLHEVTIPFLLQYGIAIGMHTDELTDEIIRRYSMLRDSYDPVTHMLLEQALDRWKQREGIE